MRGAALNRWRYRVPSAVAVFAVLIGFGALVDAAIPRERGRVHAITQVIPVPASAAATAVVAVSGLILLRIAAGLRRRKRRAWQVAVVVSSVTVATDVLKAHRIGDVAIAGALLLSLIVSRDQFRAKDDPASRWLALRVAVQFLFVAFAFGLTMLYLNPRHVRFSPSN
jgi:lysyl-tRNA synthetase, class II